MRYTLALLAAAVAVQASPMPVPGGVTSAIAPTGSAPPGCKPTYAGTFGIAVMNVSTKAKAKRQVSTIADGQPQAGSSAAVVTTISDGQPQAPTSVAAPVSVISDGQPQAPTSTAAPVSVISDGQPQAPKSTACAASEIVDGQPQECSSTPKPAATMGMVSQITDGQIQGGMHTMTMMPVSQITDGQIQATMTYMPVSVISDGQPQAPKLPTMTECAATQIADGQPQAYCTMTACAASQIVDGQPQACTMTACAASQLVDGQPQGCTTTATATAASQISDGQPQATTAAGASQLTDGQPQASTSGSAPAATSTPYQVVACKTDSTLEITLSNGILTDSKGRTGYIAANYQFQFDKPPQAGAIYTSGFSVCGNGSLALGGTNIFYQCLSGNFYNLYNTNWAPQCSPVTIESLMLVDCPSS